MKALICVLVVVMAVVMAVVIPATSAPETANGRTLTQAQAPVDETALNRHTRKIAEQLRCLVCQGETVADSQSDLAQDMRHKISEKLKLGWNEDRILHYFVARYGDFVLYNPPLKISTWVLWFGPLFMLVIGLLFLFGYLRARARMTNRPNLSPEDVERAHALLDTGKEPPE